MSADPDGFEQQLAERSRKQLEAATKVLAAQQEVHDARLRELIGNYLAAAAARVEATAVRLEAEKFAGLRDMRDFWVRDAIVGLCLAEHYAQPEPFARLAAAIDLGHNFTVQKVKEAARTSRIEFEVDKGFYENFGLHAVMPEGMRTPDKPVESKPPAAAVQPHAFQPGEFAQRPEPVRMAVREWLMADEVAYLFGDGGASKSTLMVCFSVDCALGMQPFSATEDPVLLPEPLRVLIVSGEDEVPRIHERALAAVDARFGRREDGTVARLQLNGMTYEEACDVVGARLQILPLIGGEKPLVVKRRRGESTRMGEDSTSESWDAYEDGPGMAAVLAAVKKFKPTITLIDPLVSFLVESENDNVAAAFFMGQLRRMAKARSTAVALVHHTGKAAVRGGMMDQHAGRGASAFAQNSRANYQLLVAQERDLQWFNRTWRIGPAATDDELLGGCVSVLLQHKMSYARPWPEPRAFVRRGLVLYPVAMGALQPEQIAQEREEVADRRLQDDMDAVAAWLVSHATPDAPRTKNAVRELREQIARGMSERRAKAAFDGLLAAGRLVLAERPGPNDSARVVGVRDELF